MENKRLKHLKNSRGRVINVVNPDQKPAKVIRGTFEYGILGNPEVDGRTMGEFFETSKIRPGQYVEVSVTVLQRPKQAEPEEESGEDYWFGKR